MTHRVLIVPVAYIPLAEALCIGLAGPENEGMFSAALEPIDGLVGHSHGIANGEIRQEFADLLPLNGAPGQPAMIVALAAYKGITVSLAQITALLDAIDVTDGDPFVRMDQLGLRMMQAGI